MAIKSSFYFETLPTVIISTISFILGLATTIAIAYSLWALCRSRLVRIARAVEDRTGTTRPDGKLNDAWVLLFAIGGGAVIGGYFVSVVTFSNWCASFAEACAQAVMVMAGAAFGVGLCVVVLVVLGKIAGLPV